MILDDMNCWKKGVPVDSSHSNVSLSVVVKVLSENDLIKVFWHQNLVGK